ncbi:MAG TPA: ABC transporter permease, partial [Hanamia sp.]|nr:ABC transporter permease [Hanamia sp.]
WYNFVPGWTILYLPIFLFLAFVASLSAGLYVAALNVKYRDFKYIVPFVVQFGLYISPVGFSSNIVPEKWKLLYSLNPMVGIIEGFRWSILGGDSQIYVPGMLISIAIVILMLIFSVRYFRKMEKTFADII